MSKIQGAFYDCILHLGEFNVSQKYPTFEVHTIHGEYENFGNIKRRLDGIFMVNKSKVI